jgi:hypothetical protein
MLFVLLASHAAETCPTSNAKTRELMNKIAPQIPELARKTGVKIVAGPLVNREHLTTVIVEADKAEAVDQFLLESRLNQWNSVRVLPSHTIADGLKEIEGYPPIY